MFSYKSKKLKRKIFEKSGFSLLEVTFAVALFTVLVLMSTSIFKGVVESQRSALASQNIQENLRFAYESISREIRTADGDHSGSECVPSPPHYKVFNTNAAQGFPDSGTVLFFKNRQGKCVKIATSTIGQLEITRDSDRFVVTPDEIEIKSMSFFVIDDEADAFHSVQPRVTMLIEAEMKSLKKSNTKVMKLQTTISSRYYE